MLNRMKKIFLKKKQKKDNTKHQEMLLHVGKKNQEMICFDTLIYLMTYLAQSDMAKIASVCKYWEKATRNDIIWRPIATSYLKSLYGFLDKDEIHQKLLSSGKVKERYKNSLIVKSSKLKYEKVEDEINTAWAKIDEEENVSKKNMYYSNQGCPSHASYMLFDLTPVMYLFSENKFKKRRLQNVSKLTSDNQVRKKLIDTLAETTLETVVNLNVLK